MAVETVEQIAPGIYVDGRGEVLFDRNVADPDEVAEVKGMLDAEIGRRERGGDRKSLRDRFADARQNSLERRHDRSVDREQRRDDRKDERQDRKEDRQDRRGGDREEDAVESKNVQTVYEIPTATNGGAGTADTDATILMQYDWFKVRRIIDNGSTGTSRIKQIWAGKVLLVDYGTTGILCSNFAITSQLITNANLRNLKFKLGYNMRVVYNLAAAGVGSMIFEGEAPVQASLCG